MSTVGSRLKEERLRLNLSQTKLGEIGGVIRESQGNYESDKRSPDNNYWQSVSNIGVDVQYVLTGKRNPFSARNIDSITVDQLSDSMVLMLKEIQHSIALIEKLRKDNGNAV